MGIVAEARIALRMGFLRTSENKRLLTLLRSLNLPTAIPVIKNREEFWSALAADKKSRGGTPRFVLPCAIGRSAIGVEVPKYLIAEIFEA